MVDARNIKYKKTRYGIKGEIIVKGKLYTTFKNEDSFITKAGALAHAGVDKIGGGYSTKLIKDGKKYRLIRTYVGRNIKPRETKRRR